MKSGQVNKISSERCEHYYRGFYVCLFFRGFFLKESERCFETIIFFAIVKVILYE